MALITRSVGDVSILEIKELFDVHLVRQVNAWLREAATGSPARLVINLDTVRYIDTDGLAVLVNGVKHCRGQGGDLHLCHLQAPVRAIFKMTGLDETFKVFADEAEAIRTFGALEAPHRSRPQPAPLPGRWATAFSC